MEQDFDLTLFEPTGGDMLKDYPELKPFDEFNGLSVREVKLCWYLGSNTSPLAKAELKGLEKVEAAISAVYDDRARDFDLTVKQMLSMNPPPKIVDGVSRFKSFTPSFRLQAKWMDEYIFHMLNGLVVLGKDEEQMMKLDPDTKKKYVDLSIKVSSEMPSLIARMEGGYGVKLVKKNKTGVVLTELSEHTDRLND